MKIILVLILMIAMSCASQSTQEINTDVDLSESIVAPFKDQPELDMDPPIDEANAPCSFFSCPAARLSALSIPSSAQEADLGGCQLGTERNGSAIGNLLYTLFGSTVISTLVQEDDEGRIALILLNQLDGWRANSTGPITSGLRSSFYYGNALGMTDFLVDPVSVDSTEMPFFSDHVSILNHIYYTHQSKLLIKLPLSGLTIPMLLTSVNVTGNLSFDQVGFNLTEGRITGYITSQTFRAIVEELGNTCMGPQSPQICSSISSILTGNPDQDADSLISILGGLDSQLLLEEVSTCSDSPQSCNALSVCLFIEMSSVRILGIDSP